jgi:para-aminobenzoate synthetase/4-amino-4-deoxychorismate lyase
MTPYVLFDDQKTGITRYFSVPEKIISASSLQDLDAAFTEIEDAQKSGKYLAGFLSYELGFALEPSLHHLLNQKSGTLIKLGVFGSPPDIAPPEMLYTAAPPALILSPIWSEADYLKRFHEVQKYIEAGDVYQINLTFPMTTETDWPAHKLYAAFRRAQPGRYGGIVNLGDEAIISFSPELFFEKRGLSMRMRPMKGTRPRLLDAQSDTALMQELRQEPKSQAENLMIVDLLRNDLSRFCEAGSVTVPELFTLETYPTLHQMTSQVEGTLRENLSWKDILSGLFPCGSVTGAPKIRAMEIIHDLESGTRDAYCGSMGYIEPNGDACFNVAIRTIQLSGNQLRYDVGSGVVLDSEGPDEYQECLLKSNILTQTKSGLFETLKWDPEEGFIRRKEHTARLLASAKRQKIQLNADDINSCLDNHAKSFPQTPLRIRFSLSEQGQLDLQWTAFEASTTTLRLCLSQYPLEAEYQITEQKVESRNFYDGERERVQAQHDIDEVLFLDVDGYLCEGTFTSLFIKEGDALFTPALPGLLPGVLRNTLIAEGKAIESHISLTRLLAADEIFVGNSLRGLIPGKLISKERL